MRKTIFFVVALTVLASCVKPFRQTFNHSHQVDFQEVHQYAEVAEIVYEDRSKIEEYCRLLYDEVFINRISVTDNQFFIATDHKNKKHMIAIAGTANKRNAILDARFLKQRDKKTKTRLHRGFRKAARRVHEIVLPHLKPGYDIYITGHSLGGAEAVILAMYLDVEKRPVKKVMTFGQPKVTDRRGMRKFRHLPLLRVVHKKDVVARVPPTELIYLSNRYRHFGEEVLLLNGPYYSFLEKGNAESQFAGSFWHNLEEGKSFVGDIKDHFIENYLKSLKNKFLNSEEIPFKDREKYFSEM